MHSKSRLVEKPTPQKWSLQQTLCDWGQEHIWTQFCNTGDDQWIIDAYSRGSLVLCHDGSYMPHQDTSRCLAAVLIVCTHYALQAHVVYCEHSDSYTASNYRGEIIGRVLATLLLWALSKIAQPPPSEASIPIYCDNLGIVCHGNAYHQALPEKQVQQDVLFLLKRNLMALPHNVMYKQV